MISEEEWVRDEFGKIVSSEVVNRERGSGDWAVCQSDWVVLGVGADLASE